MAEILIVKPDTLTKADKAALRKVGVVVVEAANPDDVRFIRAESELAAGDLALAAMKALAKASGSNGERALFIKLISESLERRHAPEDPQP